ncbi:MAG: methyltransferase domain-containing protein, partial [Candidatus Aenigmatarchaeota archaeon]
MKKRLLSLLACPSCGRGLSLSILKENGGKTEDGLLSCGGCKESYPVIAGILRMLPSSMINSALLSQFRQRYGNILPEKKTGGGGAQKLKEKTSESFGFQWNAFSEMYPEYEKNFLSYIEPLKPSFFRGKLVLDAGCGFGRHTYYAAKYGGEVVGFDLSDAVEAAYRNCGRMKNVHIVQGDIYHLPFSGKFSFIMSIGVLHHLPDPRAGYMKLVELARPGTLVYAWLYGKEGRTFKTVFLEGTIRKVAVRMPKRML